MGAGSHHGRGLAFGCGNLSPLLLGLEGTAARSFGPGQSSKGRFRLPQRRLGPGAPAQPQERRGLPPVGSSDAQSWQCQGAALVAPGGGIGVGETRRPNGSRGGSLALQVQPRGRKMGPDHGARGEGPGGLSRPRRAGCGELRPARSGPKALRRSGPARSQ